jgi:hypothetical protein
MHYNKYFPQKKKTINMHYSAHGSITNLFIYQVASIKNKKTQLYVKDWTLDKHIRYIVMKVLHETHNNE